MDKQRKFLLTVAYNGTCYSGFQFQENAPSVQAVLEKALKELFQEEIRVRGASRTDAGVHAEGQRVQFQTKNLGVPQEKIPLLLNRILPPDVKVSFATPVPEKFHCIYDAISKTYRYQIYNAEYMDPFRSSFFWHIRSALDFNAMVEGAEYFLGEHDFSSFCASGYQTKTSIRKIFHSSWTREKEALYFSINGNGFLYHMVRNIVGTLIEIGLKRYESKSILSILEAKNREKAGRTAPAQGLFLEEVFYPEKSFTLQDNAKLV